MHRKTSLTLNQHSNIMMRSLSLNQKAFGDFFLLMTKQVDFQKYTKFVDAVTSDESKDFLTV